MRLASRCGDATANDVCDERVSDASAKSTTLTLDDEQPAFDPAVSTGRQRAKEVPLQRLAQCDQLEPRRAGRRPPSRAVRRRARRPCGCVDRADPTPQPVLQRETLRSPTPRPPARGGRAGFPVSRPTGRAESERRPHRRAPDGAGHRSLVPTAAAGRVDRTARPSRVRSPRRDSPRENARLRARLRPATPRGDGRARPMPDPARGHRLRRATADGRSRAIRAWRMAPSGVRKAEVRPSSR